MNILVRWFSSSVSFSLFFFNLLLCYWMSTVWQSWTKKTYITFIIIISVSNWLHFFVCSKTLSLWNKRVWLTQVPKNFAKVFRWNFSSRTIANLSCNNVTENQSVVESTKWLSKVQKLLFISRKWLYKSVSPLLFLLLFWVCHNLQILKVRMLSNNLFSH